MFEEKRNAIHKFLCANINTTGAFNTIYELISKTYAYIDKVNTKTLKLQLIYNIGQYIATILKTFGLVYKTEFIDSFIFDTTSESKEDVVGPYIDTISKFRDEIRSAAHEKDLKRVFDACDKLREETLPQLGVKLEDRFQLPTVWKLYEKNELLKEIEKEKLEKEEKKQQQNKSNTKSSAVNPNNKVNFNIFSLISQLKNGSQLN